MDSILDTIKKMLNVPKEETHFDVDIIVGINSAFMVLNQLGVGPKNTFYIEDSTAKWNDFQRGYADLNPIKTVIYLRTRLVFDPPSNGFVAEAIERQIDELEWRLKIRSEELGELPGLPDPEASPEKTYVHIQNVPGKTWSITHNLNKFPSVTSVDENNNVVYGEVSYVDNNRAVVKFTQAYRGRAYLN